MSMRTRRGKPVTNQFGAPFVAIPPDATPPTPDDLGETVYMDEDENGPFAVISIPGTIPPEYANFGILWYGDLGSGMEADGWVFPAQSGPIFGGTSALGKFNTIAPTEYQLIAIDHSGNFSYMTLPRTVLSSPPTPISFIVNTNPVLVSPAIEGQPFSFSAPDYDGEANVGYTMIATMAEDASATNDVQIQYDGYIPAVSGALQYVRVGALFYNVPSGDEGPYYSNYVQITPAASATGVPPELTIAEVDHTASYYRYANKWRSALCRLPGGMLLGADPFSFTDTENDVVIEIIRHGLSVGDKFMLGLATAAAGITLSGEQTVTAVPDADHVTVTAGSAANATTTGGGSKVVYYKTQHTANLGVDPLGFVNTLTEVTVAWNSYPAEIKVGRYVTISGAIAGPGYTVSGTFPVTELVDGNYFKIDTGVAANATTVAGGSSVVAVLRNHNQPTMLGSGPLATSNGSSTVTLEVLDHKLQVGRPVYNVGLTDTGGITAANLNGLRTITAVPDSNHIQFTAGTGATVDVAAGGGSSAACLPRWYGIRWSRQTPDPVTNLIDDTKSEETPLGWQEVDPDTGNITAGTGIWAPFMELSGDEGNPDSQSPRTCWSVWEAEAFQRFRISYQEISANDWSWWSDAVSVLAVSYVPNPGALSGWIQLSGRSEIAYNAGDPDSMGLQFNRVVVPFRGTDPLLQGGVVYGQDQDCCWFSLDGGRTLGAPSTYGMYCSQMAGANWDDDALIVVGNAFATQGYSWSGQYAGLYIVDPHLKYAYRLNLTRSGVGASAGGGLVKAFVRMMHGQSYRKWQNCVARRPQTGSLTRAQRPVWIVENQMDDVQVDTIVGIYIWKLIFSDVTEVASCTMVRSLPVSWASGVSGIATIEVAPNGDVVLNGPKGVYLSTDEFATQPTQIFSRACASSKFYGGGASSVSGLIIGDASSTGGVYRTANVRTTAPTKPNGNSGLPANYRVCQMGFDGDQTLACPGYDTSKPPYVSRDRGSSWTQLPEPKRTGEESFRYQLRRYQGPAAFVHVDGMPGNWSILTFQTMEHSSDDLVTIDADGTCFFDGHSIHGVGYARDAADWDRVLQNCQDTAAQTGISSKYLEPNTIAGTGNASLLSQITAYGGGDKPYITCEGGLVADNWRIISGVSRFGAGDPTVSCIYEGRNSDGSYNNLYLYNSGKTSKMYRQDWSLKNDNEAFLGRWYITNANAATPGSVVWTDRTREYIDHAMDGTTLVSFWGNYGGSTGTQIYRGTADNGSHSLWYTPPSSYLSKGICMDPFHSGLKRVLYVPNNAPSTIREVVDNGGGIQDNLLVNLFTMAGGVRDSIEAKVGAGAYIPDFDILQLRCHPSVEGMFIASGGTNGHPNFWISWDYGVTWENASDGLPFTRYELHIHPPTGNIFAAGTLGPRIMAIPSGSTGLAHENGLTDDLLAFYAQPGVQQPPSFDAL